MSDANPQALSRKTKISLLVILAAIAFLAFSYFVWFGIINQLDAARLTPAAWGEFGDFVGGIANPLVALFALYWLTESIKVQRQELADTRSILSAQSEIDKKRNFESTFFALLEHLNSMHGRLKERQSGESSDIAYLHDRVFLHDSAEDANEALEDLNEMCSHYFISLFQTLKFVASHFQDDLRNTDELVTKLERSTPSKEERVIADWLFYCGVNYEYERAYEHRRPPAFSSGAI